MSFFRDEKVSEVRDRSNILEVVSDYLNLKKTGRNHKGLCPFHSEKTPSFMVNEEKQIFHCFGCGEGGDVFKFLMKAANLSFPQAVEELAKRFGVTLPSRESSPAQRLESERREALFQVNELASEFFHEILIRSKEGEGARRYLAARGIRSEIAKEYRLGYAPDRWDALIRHLQEKKVFPQMASELGLVIAKAKGGWYDAFRARVMFPTADLHGRVLGFGGRLMGDGQPKYLNSPESPVYHKGEILYGLPSAKNAIRESDRVLIVEGYFDLLTLHRYGIKESVATLGTALTPHHLRVLKRYTNNIITVFDGDQAGLQASLRALPLLVDEEVSAKTVLLPKGEDPDTLLRKGLLGEFDKRVSEAPSFIDFYFDHLVRTHGVKTVEGRVKVADEGMAVIRRIPNEIRRYSYLRGLAERLRLDVALLVGKLQQSPGRPRAAGEIKGQASKEAAPRSKETVPKAEEMLVRLMVHQPGLIPKVTEEKIIEEFESPYLQRLARGLEALYRGSGELDLKGAALDEDLTARLREIAFRAENADRVPGVKALQDCIDRIRDKRKERESKELTARIREMERYQDDRAVNALLVEKQPRKKEREGVRKAAL
jgi:DNA primase